MAVDDEYITKAETALNFRLPRAFRQFLLENNDSRMRVGNFLIYPVMDTSSKRKTKDTWDDVVRNNRKLRNTESFPKDLVAFAYRQFSPYFLAFKRGGSSDVEPEVWLYNSNTMEATSTGEDFSGVASIDTEKVASSERCEIADVATLRAFALQSTSEVVVGRTNVFFILMD